jgi:hypothetical protein
MLTVLCKVEPEPLQRRISAGHGARWTAERDEDGEIVVAVRFTLRELLDRLEDISGPPGADAEPGAES